MMQVNLRNVHVLCHYFSHLIIKKLPCRMFLETPYAMSLILTILLLGSMLHVYFNKWSCRYVEFRGQEPLAGLSSAGSGIEK